VHKVRYFTLTHDERFYHVLNVLPTFLACLTFLEFFLRRFYVYGFLGPHASAPKRYLDRFIRFCRAHPTHTNRYTDRAVVTSRIYAMRGKRSSNIAGGGGAVGARD